MKRNNLLIPLLAAALLLLSGLACSRLLPSNQPVKAPVVPTPLPMPTLAPLPPAPPVQAAPSLPLVPSGVPAAPAATSAPGTTKIVVTEADITRVIESGTAEQQGLVVDGLAVRFTGGKTRVTARLLSYGPVRVENLLLIGHLVAKEGDLQFETESISPSGIVTSMIPTLLNQAFKRYGERWDIQDVRTSEGQVELTVLPAN